MDKFEFFPIKCRTQRAADIYKEFRRRAERIDGGERKLKIKASLAYPRCSGRNVLFST